MQLIAIIQRWTLKSSVATKEPTEMSGKIHDRMPLMLPENKIDEWINPASDPDSLISNALSDMIIENAEG